MNQLKVGLIGLGPQGRGHAKQLMKCDENAAYRLVAVCDIRPEMFKNISVQSNIADYQAEMGFEQYRCYTDMDEMLKNEQLDMVTIALPTYMHCEATVKCLRAGLHVLCEKPMGMDVAQCQLMIDTAKETGKMLMIGQCLRFWSEYKVLKAMVDSGEFGKVTAAMFYRGGSFPDRGYENWFQDKNRGGGAIVDQHIHDVDMVQYLFGMPDAVSTSGKILLDGSNFDTLCTNYIYKDGPMAFAHNDWTLSCGFKHGFRVNFERATLEMGDKLILTRKETGKGEEVAFERVNALQEETKYFVDCILGKHENKINPPESSKDTIRLVRAEVESAQNGAMPIKL